MKLRESWAAIRWKMLIIFAFFSIVSVVLVACLSVAVLNVVIRRENAYLIEERIKVIVESRKQLTEALLQRVHGCNEPSNRPVLATFTDYLDATWPGSQSAISVLPLGVVNGDGPPWLQTQSFAGIVEDQGELEIRFVRTVQRAACSMRILVRIPINESFLDQLARVAGLEIVTSKPVMLRPYRRDQGMGGEIEANFIPGSRRPVPVVVVTRNWATGSLESWVVCQIRPSYSRTLEDLSRMGLRTASWVSPFMAISFALALAYACGLFLSLRLSQRIVAVIDGLTHAAARVGTGDFSARVPVVERDQLGVLVESFNEMTQRLEDVREQEKQRAALERDIQLAQEAQQYLYPRAAPTLPAVNIWGVSTPARIVSGDLYDFFPFGNDELSLLCADVSGKGMSAALAMAHLQAIAHRRMLTTDERGARISPAVLVETLNRDLHGRFGGNRYATMFYGEYHSRSKLLRYVNAGHCRPIFISETRETTILSDGDLPIGLFPEIACREFQMTLSSGCAIVVYSDGLIDAVNSQGQEFSEERLLSHCRSLPEAATAEAICTLLSRSVVEWSAGVERFDDATILVLAAD
ncbi:MAG TPA: SpoIIE family protein phosphatase [Bryobacteraceae bacterium]|nr:SpoIIE family protein phosphatase [Bryobacteraceae bacterium]